MGLSLTGEALDSMLRPGGQERPAGTVCAGGEARSSGHWHNGHEGAGALDQPGHVAAVWGAGGGSLAGCHHHHML